MKKYFALLLVSLVMSSCSIYSVKKGTLKVSNQAIYTVTYQASLEPGLTAKISYTDANDETIRLKDVSGNWEQTVKLRAGTNVNLKVVAKGKDLSATPKIKGKYATASFKIKVNDEVVSEYVLKNKKIKYNVGFKLP